MSERVDAELQRVEERGETAKTIYVGQALFNEIGAEPDQLYASDVVSEGQAASRFPENELDYDGIRVVLLDNVASDYLRIET
jgi:hypothetical protein